jgi:hypothetical protein
MPSAQSDALFSVAEIGVIPCAKCDKSMKLSSIEPTGPGFDVRTFECEKCNHIVKFAVSISKGGITCLITPIPARLVHLYG